MERVGGRMGCNRGTGCLDEGANLGCVRHRVRAMPSMIRPASRRVRGYLSDVTIETIERAQIVRRGLYLGYATVAYNSLEAALALAAGVIAGSVALVGFGMDSVIELTAGAAALWRLHADVHPAKRARAEALTLRIVGACFLALALYVAYDAAHALLLRERPAESVPGIVLAAASLLIMPLLARGKRRVAFRMRSGALAAEAQQTALCASLSAILLGGLALNAAAGWWWADPVAALGMVPIIAREGIEGIQGKSACGDGCC
jgi:divalent metal cation (Fe/Co/Zn/Cd) transporter